jgi:HEAT repeat protein
MSDSFRERIEAALSARPSELRAISDPDIRWLESKMELTVENLARLVADPLAEPRARALGAWLIGLTQESSLVSRLEQVARSAPPEEALWEIAKALCILKQGGPLFRELLSNAQNAVTRRVAAYALGCLRDSSAVEDLCRTLSRKEETTEVRGQAAEALGYLALESALGSLIEAAQDPLPEVRFWSVFALGQIGAPEAEPVLRALADHDDALVEGYGSVAKEAEEALARIRSR